MVVFSGFMNFTLESVPESLKITEKSFKAFSCSPERKWNVPLSNLASLFVTISPYYKKLLKYYN